MIALPGMKNKKIAVYGLGATGIASCEALVASGAEVFTWDESKAAREKTANTKYTAEHPKNWPWSELSSLVLSPGVPLAHPKPHAIVRKARAEKVEVIGDIELFSRAFNALDEKERPTVIAITGSNGKSTTAALIGHILKEIGEDAYVGGNIGEPLLAMPAFEAPAIYVLELSSYQLDLANSLRANVSILLNITPDHLERHGGLGGYAAAKRRVFLNQRKQDAAIIGVDDLHSQETCATLSAAGVQTVIPISAQGSLGRGVFALCGKLYYSLKDKTGEAGDVSKIATLAGVHNWQNASAAIAAVMHLGVAPAVAVKAMERFQGLPHRLEPIGAMGSVSFVNDSKATNIEAAICALKAFDSVFWIAGGKAKQGGLDALREMIAECTGKIQGAYLIGEAAHDIEGQLAGLVPCHQCGDLKNAVNRSSRDALQSGVEKPVVLLSPACASFDQYHNFEARGDAFRGLVREAQNHEGEAA